MNLSIGQWQIFFTYGPEYGEFIEGEEVEFRLFIESIIDGTFKGRSIDWAGIGAGGEKALVQGFIENYFIKFTKQYDQNLIMDYDGSVSIDDSLAPTQVVYEGRYDKERNVFSGTWEIIVQEGSFGGILGQQISSGYWYMKNISECG